MIFAITGNFATDQRMQRITAVAVECGWKPVLYHRPHFKYKKVSLATTGFQGELKEINPIFKSGILFYLFYNLSLFCRLLFKKAGAFYAVDSDTLPAFIALKIFRSVPLVYDAHEYFSEVPELNNQTSKKAIWNLITRWGVNLSDDRLTVGPQLAQELEKRYNKGFKVVRNVPASEPIPATTPTVLPRPTIIYQGALNEGRELELLIDAMESLPEMDALIAGEGDLSQSLRERARQMPNVIFLGLKSPAELKSLTPACFAGFNLLDASGSLSYHFSLSNKYFDYMLAGVPSISSELPEYRALNNETNAGVCIQNKKDELIKTLKNWLIHQEIHQKLKENAIIASKRFNWETEKVVLHQVFNSF